MSAFWGYTLTLDSFSAGCSTYHLSLFLQYCTIWNYHSLRGIEYARSHGLGKKTQSTGRPIYCLKLLPSGVWTCFSSLLWLIVWMRYWASLCCTISAKMASQVLQNSLGKSFSACLWKILHSISHIDSSTKSLSTTMSIRFTTNIKWLLQSLQIMLIH